jgi:serine/threonine-protein kinase RsbW
LEKIKLVIESDLQQVSLIDMLMNVLCSLGSLTNEECYQMRLCVVEAVNNAIQHAYDHEKNHSVEVDFSVDSKKMIIGISDTGKPMPRGMLTVKAGLFDKLDHEEHDQFSVPENGRGLALMLEMMDQVKYSSKDGKNTLMLIKKLKNRVNN